MNSLRIAVALFLALALAAACGDEEPPPKPPVLADPSVQCMSGESDEKELVETISVRVSDEDGDLLSDSVVGVVNGVMIEFEDPDADQVYTWTQPGDVDPPFTCGGELRLIVEASDAAGNDVRETFDVSS